MSRPIKQHVIVNLIADGSIRCFCPYDEYLQGLCSCRERFDCPEAIIEVTVLPNSRPSDEKIQRVRQATRKMKHTDKELKKANNRIKQGVERLEKALQKSRFKI